jgi:hypothetical protein
VSNRTPQPDSVLSLLKDLQKRIEALEHTPLAKNTSLDLPGSFVVRQKVPAGIPGLGTKILYTGNQTPSDPTTTGIVELYDSYGDMIVGCDTYVGIGLSRPWIPYVAHPSTSNNDGNEYMYTGSTSFVNAYDFTVIKQHPKIRVMLSAYTNGTGTTGTVDVYDNDYAFSYGGMTFSTASTVTFTPVTFPDIYISGAHMSTRSFSIRIKSSTGAQIGIKQVLIMGVQGS